MTSAEDSSDLERDVFLGSSPESDSSSLESTIKIFFLCNTVDDLEIVEFSFCKYFSRPEKFLLRARGHKMLRFISRVTYSILSPGG